MTRSRRVERGGLGRVLLAAALLLLSILPAAGASAGQPQRARRPPARAATRTALSTLRADLDRTLDSPGLEHALWGVLVKSLDTGDVLYAKGPDRLLLPASTMKIVTLAVAAERLGWDHTFETTLAATGPLENGTLRGDLLIVGSGDPTIAATRAGERSLFDEWAERLRLAGVTAVDGRIIGDDNAFEDEGLGSGWAWDDLGYGYAAPAGALQFNQNVIELTVRAGASPGDPVTVDIHPRDSGLTLFNRVATVAPDEPRDLQLRRLPGSSTLELAGTVPAGSPEFRRTASVDNPTEFFARALRASLLANGIVVRGEAIDGDAVTVDRATATVLEGHRSPPLAEIARVLMKLSQNLYAETLLKAAGGEGSTEAGRRAAGEVLEAWGIPSTAYVLADGSGLSRYNYLSAGLLVRILERMYRDPAHSGPFLAVLPVAGADGTLERRMAGTRAAGNARAKTGSLAAVRALAGYAWTRDGEPLVFSITGNNFTGPAADVEKVIDRLVERLAEFTRRSAPAP